MDFICNMFPDLDKGVIQDVFATQNEDVDKTIDELLTIAVGDDIFARSVYVEEKLSASQHLRNFGSEQERILKECKEKKEAEEKRLEQEKKAKEEAERKAKAEAERKAKAETERKAKAEADKKAKAEAERKAKEEQKKIEKENLKKIELEKRRKQEEEAAKLALRRKEAALEKERQEALEKQKIAEEAAAVLAEENRKLEELKLKFEAEELKKKTEEERLAFEKEKKELEKEKQKIKEEKERIENEKALLEEIKSTAKISIYTRNGQKVDGIDQEKIVNEIKNLLIDNEIKENEISLNDVSSDMELASFLKEICKQEEIQYPLICAGNLPIGGINRLQSLIKNESKWKNVISGDYVPEFLTEEQAQSLKDGTGVFVGQGVLDHCLDAAEYVLSSVNTLLWLPVSIVTYPFRSGKEELQKGSDDVDFDIVHTNWYWRNLKRRFRFTKTAILRIHPSLEDIRATHMYTTIEIVKIVNENSIVISYNDGSASDFVNGTKEVISSMIKLLELRGEKLGAKIVFLNEAEM